MISLRWHGRVATTAPINASINVRPLSTSDPETLRASYEELLCLVGNIEAPKEEVIVPPVAPVILDFAGMERPKTVPLKWNHTFINIGNVAEIIPDGDELQARGTLHATGWTGQFVCDIAAAQFPLELSLGARLSGGDFERVEAHEFTTVNGALVEGPMMIARRWRLDEISVGIDGVDDTTFLVENPHDHVHLKRSRLDIMAPSLTMYGDDAAPSFTNDFGRTFWLHVDPSAAEIVRCFEGIYLAGLDEEGIEAVIGCREVFTTIVLCLAVSPEGRRAPMPLRGFRAGLMTDRSLADAAAAFRSALDRYRTS